MYTPTEAEVKKVMQETGMEYMQAFRHCQSRHMARPHNQQLARKFPLGKSNS